MKVTIVGSGCGIPDPKRGSPCIAASVGNQLAVFDCGSGSLRSMATAGLQWSAIDAIYLTHFHTDHVADIAPLLFSFNIPDVERTDPLVLNGPVGLRQFIVGLVATYGDWLKPKDYRLFIQELDESDIGNAPLVCDDWTVRTARAEHSKLACAYRFEAGGVSFVYSGDTDFSESIARLATGCDLLILECSYPNELEAPGHLTPEKAADMARIAGCRQLVLTHLYPVCADYDILSQCKESYDGDVTIARDGVQFEL